MQFYHKIAYSIVQFLANIAYSIVQNCKNVRIHLLKTKQTLATQPIVQSHLYEFIWQFFAIFA